ncbi:MAG: glycoside hydrolase family 127 protein, partial [Clostridia bacterium]|nr:glycoside hydrolase family 127 protein [Clostridia bacterium]
DVRDSAWVGGNCEGWERVPYWLDGFIPTACLLQNEDAIARAKYYINAILDRQQEDGWICPCTVEQREKYDVWGYFLIGKVLAQYCEFFDDPRAEDALRRAMLCLFEQLKAGKVKLFSWGKFRYYECMIPLQYLYDQKPEDWITEFAELLCAQGEDYDQYKDAWTRPLFKWTLYTHIVNLTMRFKQWAVVGKLLNKPFADEAEEYWQFMEKYNGMPVGVFYGDECLGGKFNNHGAELCSVVELMYSCELLYAITGDPVWADRLEKMAFNALPATISDDMWSHQYVQMTNQIACIRFPGKSIFRTNGKDAHIFGLEPEFGCCTANHVQGWPKLLTSNFIRTSDGIRLTSLLPSELNTVIDGVPVCVRIETEYPFRLSAKVCVTTEKKLDMALHIRIPAFAKTCTLDGVPQVGKEIVISRTFDGSAEFEIVFTDKPRMIERPYQLNCIEYGPLVFSLPIEAEYKMYEYVRKDVERKFPYCDYELYPKSEWRYAFADFSFKVEEAAGSEIPFDSHAPRLLIKTHLCRINWETAEGYEHVSAVAPASAVAIGKPEEISLVPYGCAKLRMTEMPMAIKGGK